MARATRQRRPDYDWDLGAFNILAFSAGTSGGAMFIANRSLTVVRSRGEVLTWLDATSAPGIFVQVAMGLYVVPEDSGSVVTVNPLSDTGASDFFWFDTFTLGYEEMVTDVIDIPLLTAKRSVIDAKAMRKMKSGQQI